MIIRTRGGDVEYRTSLAELGLVRSGYGPSAGMNVTPGTVRGIPAVNAAVTFAAEAVACLPMRTWKGEAPLRKKVITTWQARLFNSPYPNPDQTWFEFWEIVQSSLDYRGNAFIWKSKDANGRVIALWALHPDQVYLRRENVSKKIIYRVATNAAYTVPYEIGIYANVGVDSSVVLHIRGRGGMGEVVSPSPIQLFITSLGSALAKQQHEANLFKNGASGGLVVSFPAGITKPQADQWRDSFDSDQAGVNNAGKTKVVGGGATVTQIGMTQADAQWAEAMQLSLIDVSNIFRVPGWFLGVSIKNDKPVTPEHEQQRWANHGLNPRLTRIEAAINSDPDLFGAGASICASFDTAGLIRGDLTTQDTIAHQQIQDGRLLVDEWRIENGRDPLPGGVGMIPQIVPVGGAPNPKLTPNPKPKEE
jgi:HK97 family phage portal protein